MYGYFSIENHVDGYAYSVLKTKLGKNWQRAIGNINSRMISYQLTKSKNDLHREEIKGQPWHCDLMTAITVKLLSDVHKSVMAETIPIDLRLQQVYGAWCKTANWMWTCLFNQYALASIEKKNC